MLFTKLLYCVIYKPQLLCISDIYSWFITPACNRTELFKSPFNFLNDLRYDYKDALIEIL